ncbi:MAG: DUF1579 domain-containing protein [Rhizobium sp.]|nr:DUF1579 domain-containing protein [Rhizobium sp.]
MEFAKPREEHRFLEKLVGDWVVTSSTGHENYDPGDPAKVWTETVRSVGGLWFLAEGRGTMPDGNPGEMIMTLGYEAALGHYVGTWVGSMMDKLWIYKGWIEPDGKTLTLEAEGPSFEDPQKTAIYHDVIHLIDDDHRTFSGSVRLPDGSFKIFMTSEMQRRA